MPLLNASANVTAVSSASLMTNAPTVCTSSSPVTLGSNELSVPEAVAIGASFVATRVNSADTTGPT